MICAKNNTALWELVGAKQTAHILREQQGELTLGLRQEERGGGGTRGRGGEGAVRSEAPHGDFCAQVTIRYLPGFAIDILLTISQLPLLLGCMCNTVIWNVIKQCFIVQYSTGCLW